jgi:hypothetical protein
MNAPEILSCLARLADGAPGSRERAWVEREVRRSKEGVSEEVVRRLAFLTRVQTEEEVRRAKAFQDLKRETVMRMKL